MKRSVNIEKSSVTCWKLQKSVEAFQQVLGCWSSSQMQGLWSFMSGIQPYLVFSQYSTALSGSGWEVFARISNLCWGTSTLRSWSYTFPTIH